MACFHWQPDLRRCHPRPPCSQRPSHRSHRRESEASALQTSTKGLTTSPQLCQKSIASKATSSRIAGRHHLGISGRPHRNLQPRSSKSQDNLCYRPAVIREIDIWRVAVLMVNRYGDEAKLDSLRRAAELTVDGDHAGTAIWRRVAIAIEQLTDTTGLLN